METDSSSFLTYCKDSLKNPVTFFVVIIGVSVAAKFYFVLVQVVWQYCSLLWAYWKIPSYHADVNWIFRIIFRLYPKNISFSGALFQIILNACKQCGREGICVLRFFYPYLVIFNEEFCKKLFGEPSMEDKSVLYNLEADVFGNGLFTSDADGCKTPQKLLTPAFQQNKLKRDLEIFNVNAAALVRKLQEVAGKPTVKVVDSLKSQIFKILTESILGPKLKDEKYKSKVATYAETIERVKEINKLPRPWFFWTLPLFREEREHKRLSKDLRNFTEEILLKMKNSIPTARAFGEESDCSKKSISEILLEEHLKNPTTYTLKDVIDEVTTVMATGHETASYALMWCLYLLGRHPQVQAKAFKETQNIKGRDITYKDLSELNFLECVIKETLRLYPTMPLCARKSSREIQCDGFTIPEGAEVYFFLYLMHRNPDTYKDPEAFKPERFSGNSDTRPWMFMPFAEGDRACIGKSFTLMEIKVMLVHILRRFEIKTLDTVEEKDLDWSTVLRPVKPVRMLFTVRK